MLDGTSDLTATDMEGYFKWDRNSWKTVIFYKGEGNTSKEIKVNIDIYQI